MCPSWTIHASVGCRFPLDGLTRSAHRDCPYCFHAERPIEQRRNSPIERSSIGYGAARGSYSTLYGTSAASAARPEERGNGRRGAPWYRRNGFGWVAQSRYPSDRANRLKWCLVASW